MPPDGLTQPCGHGSPPTCSEVCCPRDGRFPSSCPPPAAPPCACPPQPHCTQPGQGGTQREGSCLPEAIPGGRPFRKRPASVTRAAVRSG